MRTTTRQAIFLAINALLLQIVVASSNALAQLYPLDEVNLELEDILARTQSQDAELGDVEQPANELTYLVDDSVSEKETQPLDMDLLQELVEDLRQSDESQPLAPQLNRHLPSAGVEGETSTSGPVNDPADFDVSLSQLTNSLNHWIPNTNNRSAFLDTLLSAYLEQQQQLGNSIMLPNAQVSHHNDIVEVPKSQPKGSEYIDQPLGLLGHHYMQGGAGEGHQLLGPDGTFENIQVIKTDLAVPSYCDPPNPCPIGYTAADGCLEDFVNSASFSREYQVKQKCSCDNEHSLFNCGEPPSSDIFNNDKPDTQQESNTKQQKQDTYSTKQHARQLETLARAVQNRFGNLASVRNLIDNYSVSM